MMRKNLDTEEHRDYWKCAEETRKKVAAWPQWKRDACAMITVYITGDARIRLPDSEEDMMQNQDKENNAAVEMAERHWSFLESWLHKIYIDAFIHGYKHGFIDSMQ